MATEAAGTAGQVDRPVGVALVGCGRVSDSHLGAISSQPDLGRVVAVVDLDLERAKRSAAQHGARYAFSTLEEALKIDDVEAIDICLPNDLHADAAVAALDAGRHVLVEKPMAHDAAASARMAQAAERSGCKLAVAQSMRHYPAIRYLRENQVSYGRLCSAEVAFCKRWDGPQAPWWRDRKGFHGLILSLLAPHSLDFVQMIMGSDPERIHAECVRQRACWEGEDEAMILLSYPDRRMASVHLSYNQVPMVNRKILFFENCVVEVENDEEVQVDGRVVYTPSSGKTDQFVDPTEHFLRAEHGFAPQFAEFAKAVRGLPNSSVLHREGYRLMRVVDAVRRSALSGKTEELEPVTDEAAHWA